MEYINQKKELNILLIYVYIINILNLPDVHTTYQCRLLVQNYPSVKNNKIKKNELLTQLNYSLIILMYQDL